MSSETELNSFLNCTICTQNIDSSVNQDTTTIISQTICKIFTIQDDFQSLRSLSCCPNCSSQILKIHTLLEELDEAKLQLDQIVIKNAAAGDFSLDQNSADCARNEIIKRISPFVNPIAINIKVENDQVLNQVLDEFLDDPAGDPDWNAVEDGDADNFFENEQDDSSSPKQTNSYINPDLQKKFQLKIPVLMIERLSSTLYRKFRPKNHGLLHNKKKKPNLLQPNVTWNECKECGKNFKDRKYFKKHVKSHSNPLLHNKKKKPNLQQPTFMECKECGKNFKDRKYFKRHIKSHSNPAPDPTPTSLVDCQECGKQFTGRQYLDRHIKSHSNKNSEGEQSAKIKELPPERFKCTFENCNRTYLTAKYLSGHISMTHIDDKAQLKCPKCYKVSKNRYCLRLHLRTVHKINWRKILPDGLGIQGRNFKCSQCIRTFYTDYTLQKHVELQHSTKPSSADSSEIFCCHQCGKILKSATSLKYHIMQIHEKDFQFFCSYCPKGFVNKGNLIQHLQSHEKSKISFSCTICNEEFPDENTLWTHKLEHKKLFVIENDQNHKDVRPENSKYQIYCDICGAGLTRKAFLQPHMACVHGIGQWKYNCHICVKPIFNKSALRKHLQGHKRKEEGKNAEKLPKPFKCTECSKAFTIRSRLQIHISAVHLEAFKCKFCFKSFSGLYILQNHMKDHHKSIDELKFPCPNPKCSKRFFDEGRLNAHIGKHDSKKVKKVTCEVCQKVFPSFNLKVHMRTHTGEKPFSCSICSRGFHIKQLMLNHEATHSDLKSFNCTVCNKSFKLLRYLSRHKLNSPGCKL